MAAVRKLVLTRLVDFSAIVAMVTLSTPTTRLVSVSLKLCKLSQFLPYSFSVQGNNPGGGRGDLGNKIDGVLVVIFKETPNMYQNGVLW